MKLYFFTSTRKSDKCRVTVKTSSEERAMKLLEGKFLQWGYKGKPKRLAF